MGVATGPRWDTPPLQATFLEPEDPRWQAALEGLQHDIYHRPGYVAYAARYQERGRPVAYLAQAGDARLFIPLIIRSLPAALGTDPSLTDAISPRGFPGPLIGPEDGVASDTGSFADEALARFVVDLRREGIVSAFIRTHPLIGPPTGLLRRHGGLVGIGHSFSIDLGRSDDELWRRMRENHQRDIRRAREAGYAVWMDDDWSRFDGFMSAFEETMTRVGAAPHWRLTRDDVAALRESLGEAVHLCVVERDGELAAASLITESDGIAEYHLAGTIGAHLRASPSKLIIPFACSWARERRHGVLHLAGSPVSGDSLAHFKAGFATARHTMCSWRVVADEVAYDGLVRAWEGEARGAAGTGTRFFPAYRRPLSDGVDGPTS